MEDTKANPQTLYVYECRCPQKHRIYRRDDTNKAPCSHCDTAYNFVAIVPRLEGESEQTWHVRCLTIRKAQVN